MFKIFKPFDKNVKEKSNPGSKFRTEYTVETLADGTKQVVECGKTNVWEKIQEANVDTEVKDIMYKIEHNIPVKDLNGEQGQYVDVVSLPKNIHEAHEMGENAKSKIAELEAKELALKAEIEKEKAKTEQAPATPQAPATLQGGAE